MKTRVMVFGVHSIIEHHGEALAESEGAHRYYNDLLELRLKEERERRALRAKFVPGVAELEAELAANQVALDRIFDAIRKTRKDASAPLNEDTKATPKRLQATPEQEVEIDRLRSERKALWKRMKPLDKAFVEMLQPGDRAFDRRTSGASEELLEQIAEIGKQLKAAKKTKGNPDVAQLARALAGLKDRKKANAPATHKKSAANAAVLAEMLKEEEWSEAWKSLARLRASTNDAARRLRGESGLAHGTYDAVEKAVGQALAMADDLPGFKRWNGGRKIGMQIGKLTGGQFMKGGDSKLKVLRIDGDRGINKRTGLPRRPVTGKRAGKRRYAIVALPVSKGDSKRWVTCSVLLHRPIPDDAVITWAYLVPRRVGLRTKHTLQLTMNLSDELVTRERGTGTAQVRLGWSRSGDGSIVVALVNGDEPITVRREVIERIEHARFLKGRADRYFTWAIERLSAWMAAHPEPVRLPPWIQHDGTPAPELLSEVCEHIGKWKAHGKLAMVAKRWAGDSRELWREWRAHRDDLQRAALAQLGDAPSKQEIANAKERTDYFEANPDALAEWLTQRGITDPSAHMSIWLEWWRRKDAHLIQWAADEYSRARRRRKDGYRVAASNLAKKFARVELFELDLARLAERHAPGDGRPELHAVARDQRVMASPHEFKEALAAAFGPDRFREIKRERSGDAPDPGGARNDDESAENKGDDVASDKAAE